MFRSSDISLPVSLLVFPFMYPRVDKVRGFTGVYTLTLSFARTTDKNAFAAYISKTRSVRQSLAIMGCTQPIHFLMLLRVLPLSLPLFLSLLIFCKKYSSLSRALYPSLFLALALRLDEKKWVGGMKWQGEMRRSGEESGSTVRESLFLHASSARTDRSPLSRSQYTPRRYIAAARKGIPDTKHAAFRNIVPAKRRRRQRRCRRRWRRAAATAVDALDGRSSRRTRGARRFFLLHIVVSPRYKLACADGNKLCARVKRASQTVTERYALFFFFYILAVFLHSPFSTSLASGTILLYECNLRVTFTRPNEILRSVT